MPVRTLIAALALLAAPAALAQPQPAAPFVSYAEAFDQFAKETATLPSAERVRAFRAKFNALVPGFYEPRFGATEARYDAHLEKVLAYYPANRDRFLAAARDFSAAYATADARFRGFFPDYAPSMPIYLLHSLGEMDGGTRELRGKAVAVFGADVIAKIHDRTSIGPFLDHELFHFYHAAYFPDCEALWCSLWQEGLATYVAGRMNPGSDDRALMLTIPRPMRPEVEPRLAEAMCLTRARLDSTSREDYAAFFFGNGKSAFPPRFGYFIGYLLAKRLGDGMSLEALAKLPPEKVKPLLIGALTAYACPSA
jgi:hypothetical protein